MTEKHYAQGSTLPPLKDGVVRLYSMRFCPYALKARMVLIHKNISHEVVNINLKKKPDWFLAATPLGLVPTLQVDDKLVVDSAAICDYLDDVYPEKRLQPAEPFRRAWDRVLHEYSGKAYAALMAVPRSDPSEFPQKLAEVETHLKFFEDQLKSRNEGPFFGGSEPAMIDFLLWPTFDSVAKLAVLLQNPKIDVDADRFPGLTAYVKAIEALPAFKQTAISAETHIKFFKSIPNEVPDYDVDLE